MASVLVVSISWDDAARRKAGILLRPRFREDLLDLVSPESCRSRASLEERTARFLMADLVLMSSSVIVL